MQKVEKADIKIKSSFYSSFGRMDIEIDQALKEFIDNSTSSFDDNREELYKLGEKKCRVIIEWTDDVMVITDNAFGMEREAFGRALQLNARSNNYSEASRSKYGLGLKYAVSNIGRWYSIESTQFGSKNKYFASIDYDILEIDAPDEIDLIISDTLENKHYTRITIKNLYKKFSEFNQPSKKKTAVKFDQLISKLSKVYSYDILNGKLEIIINNRRVEPHEPVIMKNPDTGSEILTQFTGDFDHNGLNYKYNGWVAMLATGDHDNAGFTLLQHDRAIMLNYKPTEIFGKSNDFAHQRIIGEIYLNKENWVVTFTKTGFVWDDNGLQTAFINSILENADIMEIFNISRKYRKTEQNVSLKELGKMNLQKAFSSLKSVEKPVVEAVKPVDKISTAVSQPNTVSIKKTTTSNETVTEEQNNIINISYEGIEYHFELITPDKSQMEGKLLELKVKNFDNNEYYVNINTRVSLLEEFKSKESKNIIVKMAISIALAQVSSKRLGLKSQDAKIFVDKLNDILANAS